MDMLDGRSGPNFVFCGPPSRSEALRCLLNSQKMPLFMADGSPALTGFMGVGNIYGKGQALTLVPFSPQPGCLYVTWGQSRGSL